jgi:putative ABC transport system substrate-binding protein
MWEGRDVVIEPRFAEQRLERLPSLASELVNANVDLIVALGGPAAVAAQKATSTIPIIFSIVTDPIALNLVASMDKPGSNVTGITSLDPEQARKQLELLKEAFPGIKRVAILSDQTLPGADERGLAPIDRANEAAARALGLEPQVVKVKGSADLEAAIAAMIKERAEALLVRSAGAFHRPKASCRVGYKKPSANDVSWRPSGRGRRDYLWDQCR